MKQAALWLVVAATVIGMGVGFGAGAFDFGTVVLVAVLGAAVVVLAFRASGPADSSWLPWVMVGGYAAKLVGSWVRHQVLVDVYNRSGDAVGYHNRGRVFNDAWRSFEIPEIDVGSAGTSFVSKAAALVYAPYEPSDMLQGFFLFATIAFVGQLMFYLAYRQALPQKRLRWYAVAVFFVPSLVYWPASIGKESLMLFFIGLIAWGGAHLLHRYRIRWLGVVALGLAGAGAIRLHVAALFGLALAIAVLLGKAPAVKAAKTRRLILMAAAALSVALLVTLASASLGVDLSGDDLDPFLSELERRTQQGGSAVEGQPVRSLPDLPAATLRVLYRPLLNEAVSIQTLATAVEGTILLALSLLALPSIVRNLRNVRRYPYMVFCMASVAGFVVAFSAIFNLGILARQRSQVLPLVLAILIAMGTGSMTRDSSEGDQPDPAKTRGLTPA